MKLLWVVMVKASKHLCRAPITLHTFYFYQYQSDHVSVVVVVVVVVVIVVLLRRKQMDTGWPILCSDDMSHDHAKILPRELGKDRFCDDGTFAPGENSENLSSFKTWYSVTVRRRQARHTMYISLDQWCCLTVTESCTITCQSISHVSANKTGFPVKV